MSDTDTTQRLAKKSEMVATQRLSKDAPKVVPCPKCDRRFVNQFALEAHQKALGHAPAPGENP